MDSLTKDFKIDDKRHILHINEKKYMFFLCFKSGDEYIISSQDRNLILQKIQNIINFSFLSDRYFNMYLKTLDLYLYSFLVDRDIKNGLEHLQFIKDKSNILRHIFQRDGFVDSDSSLINRKFIKLKYFKINKNNIVNRLKNKSQVLFVSENVNFLFNIFIENNETNILCCLPSISMNIKDIVELLK